MCIIIISSFHFIYTYNYAISKSSDNEHFKIRGHMYCCVDLISISFWYKYWVRFQSRCQCLNVRHTCRSLFQSHINFCKLILVWQTHLYYHTNSIWLSYRTFCFNIDTKSCIHKRYSNSYGWQFF